MKKLEVIIASILVKITYYLTYLFPINNKQISIISYFNNDLGLEFSKLVNQLNNNYKFKYDLRKFNNSYLGKFQYLFSFIHQTYLFNTSKLIILDGNSFVYSRINAKNKVQVMQLWHAIGAIKEFGQASERRYEIKGYDYLITSSDYFRDIFSLRLNTKKDHTFDLGNIKSDYLFDNNFINENKVAFYQKYPQYKNKRIILYAPTFRGKGIDDINFEFKLDELKNQLKDDEVLIIKKHPLTKTILLENDLSNEDLYQLLIVSDIIISDYSALIFEAILLKKKLILYWYDYEKYVKERGICIDIKQLNLPIVYNICDLCDIICKIKNNDYQDQKSYFLNKCDGHSLDRVIELIKNIMDGEMNA
ncbi:MAG: CDP-glycerol glycerophosphotransferase family protein [Bacilli bacterium]|jgi:CDP-ribitol ribitolphosphotransferase|nr:CDP-glycerol glycerophosphotransferase family protein [Bacilli bacterium]